MCWIYVKKCIIEHIIDKIFPVTSETPVPQVQVLEPRLAPPTLLYLADNRGLCDQIWQRRRSLVNRSLTTEPRLWIQNEAVVIVNI